MIFSLPQNLFGSSETIDPLEQQSRHWSMVSSLLLVVGMLVLVTQSMNASRSKTSKNQAMQNVLALNYRIIQPASRPVSAAPPEPVEVKQFDKPAPETPEPEPVLQKVGTIVSKPPPLEAKRAAKVEEDAPVRPLKAVRQKMKNIQKPAPVAAPAVVETQPVKNAVNVTKEAAAQVQELADQEPKIYEQMSLDTIPTAQSKNKPDYPYRARRMNVTGFVEIRFLVNNSGRVEKVEIIQAKPKGVFEESVRETVLGWRFNPGIKNNRAVATWMATTIDFGLE